MAYGKTDDSAVIKGVYGKVVSLDLGKHMCILSMEKQRKRLGYGLLDTTRLEEHLQGVSDLRTFLSISTEFITKIKPLTKERANEFNWHGGKWEALWVRPKGNKPDVRRIPAHFVGRSLGLRKVPSIAYCEQRLTASSGPPPERIGDAISALRKIMKHWDVFPLQEILNVLLNRDEFSDIRQYFSSSQDVLSFAKSLPQYFVVINGNRAIGFPYRFSEQDYKTFLKQQSRPFRRGVLPPYILIEDTYQSMKQVRMLLDRANGRDQLILAVDCEGVDLDLEHYYDNNVQVDVNILDFSKAFDVVSHRKLLAKINHYGIRGGVSLK